MGYGDKTSCLRKQWNCTNRIETCLYDILYCPRLAVLTQPDLSSGTTTNRSTHHKQTTLVTSSCTVNGIDQSYTELSEIVLEPYQASVELDASRFTHEIAYAACSICRLLPDAAIE